MAETIFRQWFVEEADDGWEETTIENVCVKVASGGTPSTKVGEYYNGDINWYSTRELNDTFLYESSTKITNSGLENSSAKMFPENTVLIAIYAAPTVGRLGILANDATFNQAACGFKVDENKICFEYLYLHFLFSRQKLNDIASGSAQQNLNVKIIKNLEIILPPASIIQRFKCVVRPIFQQIKLNTRQIMTLEKLRDTLLPKLMSGEVKVEYEEN
jgi:type I restriction enzyme S subunit